jgi:hypothetical protein
MIEKESTLEEWGAGHSGAQHPPRKPERVNVSEPTEGKI